MQPLRFPMNKLSTRARAFNLIKERSFRRGDFVLVSGKKSQFYLDMKPTMFHPEGANLLSDLIFERIQGLKPDYVGGLEMGAVPLVSAINLMSQIRNQPISGFFVRKEVKDHGTKNRVESAGEIKGKRVVILEDVTTSGSSAMQAVKAVQAAGASVLLVLSIVDREEGAAEFYRKENVPFDCLFRVSEFMAA
jgi:orotate phosphoribosyltransferase